MKSSFGVTSKDNIELVLEAVCRELNHGDGRMGLGPMATAKIQTFHEVTRRVPSIVILEQECLQKIQVYMRKEVVIERNLLWIIPHFLARYM